MIYPKKIPRRDHDSQLLEFVANATPFHTKKMIKLVFVTHRSPKVTRAFQLSPNTRKYKKVAEDASYTPNNVNRGTLLAFDSQVRFQFERHDRQIMKHQSFTTQAIRFLAT